MPKLYPARVILSVLPRQTLTVIVPNHKEVALETFTSILKQTGTNRKEFEKLLK